MFTFRRRGKRERTLYRRKGSYYIFARGEERTGKQTLFRAIYYFLFVFQNDDNRHGTRTKTYFLISLLFFKSIIFTIFFTFRFGFYSLPSVGTEEALKPNKSSSLFFISNILHGKILKNI